MQILLVVIVVVSVVVDFVVVVVVVVRLVTGTWKGESLKTDPTIKTAT